MSLAGRKGRIVAFSTTASTLVGGPTAVVGWGLIAAAVPITSRFLGALAAEHAPHWALLLGPAALGVGVTMALLALHRGLKLRALLCHGALTQAQLAGKRNTARERDGYPVYELEYHFEANGKRYAALARSHEPERCEDGASQPVLYLQTDPSSASLLDQLPFRPQLTELTVDSSDTRALLHLILPVVALLEIVFC